MIMSRIISLLGHRSVGTAFDTTSNDALILRTDNGPQITKAIREVLKEDYNYDSSVSPLSLPDAGLIDV
jgi:hypothetical protein